MSGNPFKINGKVSGSFEVEEVTTSFKGINSKLLKWREEQEGLQVLTLDEILNQTIEYNKSQGIPERFIPFIRVNYETGMWGVIFEVGNYRDLGSQWIIHGVTKGYG